MACIMVARCTLSMLPGGTGQGCNAKWGQRTSGVTTQTTLWKGKQWTLNFLVCPPAIKPGNENSIFSTGKSAPKEGFPITKLDYLPGTCCIGGPSGPSSNHFFSTCLKASKSNHTKTTKNRNLRANAPLTPVFLLSFFNSTSADFGCLAELGSIAWQPTWHVFFIQEKTHDEIHLRTWSWNFRHVLTNWEIPTAWIYCNAFRLASYSCPFHNHSAIPWDKIV